MQDFRTHTGISKSAYNSYVKKYKKKKKLKLKKLSAGAAGEILTNTAYFIEPGRSMTCFKSGGRELVNAFFHDFATTNTQNYFYAFQLDRSSFFPENRSLTRLVFGPPVTGNDNKRNTFQELDYNVAYREAFDVKWGCPYLCDVLNIYNVPLFKYDALSISDLKLLGEDKTAAGTIKNYRFTFNDSDSDFANVRGGVADTIGIDTEIVKEVRIIKVNLSSSYKSYTDNITTGSGVAFRLFSSAGSFFYMNGLAEQNLKTI